MGALFAFIAMVGWGIGDFLIQKSTRRFGNWNTLFFISIVGAIGLFPLVFAELRPVFTDIQDLFILSVLSIVILIAAMAMYQAYKIGKLSIVEAICTIELPIVAFLAFFALKERLLVWQAVVIIILFIGVLLTSTRSFSHYRKIHLEKGIWFAIAGGSAMGVSDFLFGMASRQTSPFMVNWFTSLFLSIACVIYLACSKEITYIGKILRNNKILIIFLSIVDVSAWVAISYGTLYSPMGVVFGISQAYVALAAMLGLVINKEKLRPHQWVGLLTAIIAAITLAYFS